MNHLISPDAAGFRRWRAGGGIELRAVRSLALFAEAAEEDVAAMMEQASIVRLPANTPIFSQGEMPEHLHAVLDGQVGLIGLDDAGEQTVVEILRPGTAFIEAAVLTDLPYLMGAKTLLSTTLLLLPAQAVRDEVARRPTLAQGMLKSMAGNFRLMVTEIKNLKLRTASQRLALYLLGLSERKEGAVILTLPHSKGVIAARIGIRPETLSRAFNGLKTAGVIIDGPRVSIADIARLSAFCAG